MCIHTSSAPLRPCYVHLEHGSLIFLSEKWGSMSPRNTVAWNMRYKSNSYPQTIPKPHFQHVSCDQEFYTVYQKKTPQNSIAAIAPPPRTLWTQCWATPEAPVESGRASPLASPCPPGCSAVAPHSDSPHRRVGQNAQDRHLQNEKSWDFGLLLKICLRSFKTKQFGSFGSQISEGIHVPAAISTPLCHCSKVDSKCAWWATTTIMSPKLILHIPHLFQGWGSTKPPPSNKCKCLKRKRLFFSNLFLPELQQILGSLSHVVPLPSASHLPIFLMQLHPNHSLQQPPVQLVLV